ncbi:hypothetical protein [Campylobacter corcagiensis]|uniref:Histidine kinase n=1 Tax=Campylobacter corcagiensis TaxID=1448857 RepID=A0A7M1LKC1_9BACT|nr:hypothetical protein [Campylobacter corcagiensis]QKF65441.1 hypothetical protein CCORG_1610 [Campylobacter corcagiensis]QOQ87985.1 hypothetical protein IMC76_04095 [Campylobacter corcagiensis]
MTSKEYKILGIKAFKSLKFDAAKNYFSLALNDKNKDEIMFLVSLCEVAKHSFDDANMLFDFYTFLVKDAKDMSELWELLESIEIKHLDDSLTSENVITYDELRNIIKKGINFKDAIEGVMASTKLVIKNSDNFLDFILNLLDNGMEESAINYFETFLEIHGSFDDKTQAVARKIQDYENRIKR